MMCSTDHLSQYFAIVLGADTFDQMSATIIATALGLPNDESEGEASIDHPSWHDDKSPEDLLHSVENQRPPAAEPEKHETKSEIPS